MKRKLQMRFITLLVMIIAIGNSINAQSGWQEVYSTDGTEAFMQDICFVPGTDGTWSTGWAVAREGYIVKTEDGGDTWTEISQNLSSQLSGVSFSDQDTGYISTFDNKILKSIDGGATWSTIYNGTVYLNKIAFKDGLTGVASGTEKIYTSDGGATWTTGTGGSSYSDMDYAGGDTYYGVNLMGGDLGKSADGGATWTNVESLSVLAFMTDWLDEQSGMYGGDFNTIEVTSDGGSSWINNTLGDGQDVIRCGGFFDADTMYACGALGEVFKSTNAGVSWTTDTSFTTGVFEPRGLVVTGANVIFAAANSSGGDGKVWRKIGAPIIDADFEANQTEVCAGSSIDFTDLSFGPIDSWSWEFEGGTPATSTDQNPTVTYGSTGFYDVKLVVTVGGFTDSLTMTDYIEVVELPAEADMPEGDDAVCTSMVYEYTTNDVLFAKEYEWEIVPSGAGILEADGATAYLTVDEDFTGDFTIRVRASNVCGDGDWSVYFEGTVYQSPEEYTLEGGGGYCLDGDGVEIILDGSQTDVDYELYLDGEATGNIVEGTGSEISFGLVTDEAYYICIASNENCSQMMIDQIQVYLLYPPLEPGIPTGPEVICEETISDYETSGSEDTDSYEWMLSPEEAGNITGDSLAATVEWAEGYTGLAYISVYGINECGDGNPSEELEIRVGAPNPEITGESMVCDWSDEFYEVTENEGSTYTWEATGGSISDGQGTYMITVSWEGEGIGSITVSEETAGGCEDSSELFEVTIDDCTVVEESGKRGHCIIYPNPAHDILVIRNNGNIRNITVFNSVGKKVLKEATNSAIVEVNISDFLSGIYIFKIETDDGVIVNRVVKN